MPRYPHLWCIYRSLGIAHHFFCIQPLFSASSLGSTQYPQRILQSFLQAAQQGYASRQNAAAPHTPLGFIPATQTFLIIILLQNSSCWPSFTKLCRFSWLIRSPVVLQPPCCQKIPRLRLSSSLSQGFRGSSSRTVPARISASLFFSYKCSQGSMYRLSLIHI